MHGSMNYRCCLPLIFWKQITNADLEGLYLYRFNTKKYQNFSQFKLRYYYYSYYYILFFFKINTQFLITLNSNTKNKKRYKELNILKRLIIHFFSEKYQKSEATNKNQLGQTNKQTNKQTNNTSNSSNNKHKSKQKMKKQKTATAETVIPSQP